MNCSRWSILLAVVISQAYSAPQFITLKDGKLGLNIGGFHAGIGIGGILDGKGTSGGLYAEAGTPFGQSARAGLGGSMDEKGGVSGRLYAGASGGGNLKVSAGLGGAIGAAKSTGGGFATAQAGNRVISSKMGDEALVNDTATIISTDTNDVQQLDVKPLEVVIVNKEIQANQELEGDKKPVFVEQVYVEQQPQQSEKRLIHTYNKPRRQNFHKTKFLGGYIGPEGEIVPPEHENIEPTIQKRIDVGIEASASGAADNSGGGQSYTKLTTYQRNPTFFQDIFNIPISTLKAVSALLGNTAANTNISVQKSASAQAAETDSISEKRDSSSVSSSSAHISVETPSASKLVDDIFAIPINTLSAVNKFLENNVSGRKNIQVRREGGEPTRVKLGPHARRRANKQVVIVQEAVMKDVETKTD